MGVSLANQQHRARAFDRGGELALMFRAVAGDSARQNLAAFGHEFLQQIRLFVVEADLVLAEFAVALDEEIALRPSRFHGFKCPWHNSPDLKWNVIVALRCRRRFFFRFRRRRGPCGAICWTLRPFFRWRGVAELRVAFRGAEELVAFA